MSNKFANGPVVSREEIIRSIATDNYLQRVLHGRQIAIENTRFIFATNFAGDPTKDRYNDNRRKANLLIPDPEQAKDLIKAGFKVRETRPRPDDDPSEFIPEFFVSVLLKYRNKAGQPVKYPPKVYLVSGDSEPVLLDEDSVADIDNIRIKNVNVILNPYEYDPANNGLSLYIRTMYVEQDIDDDPYAIRYRRSMNNFRGQVNTCQMSLDDAVNLSKRYAEYEEEPF